MRALAFARAVLARWDRRVVSPLPLGVVFLRRPTRRSRQAPVVFSQRRNVHLHLRPQVSLALVRSVRAAGENHHHRAGDRTTLLTPLVLRASTAVEAQRLVERLLVRGTRVEVAIGSVEGGPIGPSRPARVLIQTPPLAVRRRDGAAGDERRDARREPAGAADRLPAAADLPAPAIAAAEAEAGVDVGRLTDQVMAAIDRRLVAQAERLGRS